MDGYFMFTQKLTCRQMRPDQIHPRLFQGANQKFRCASDGQGGVAAGARTAVWCPCGTFLGPPPHPPLPLFHTHTHAHTHARAHAHTHAHTRTRTHAHTHTFTHTRALPGTCRGGRLSANAMIGSSRPRSTRGAWRSG